MKLRFWERPKFYGCRITLEQLEERIVLDAAGGASQQTEDQQQDTTHQTVADAQQTAAQTTTAQAPAPVGSVTPPGQAASQSPQQTDNLAKVIPHNDLNVVLVSNDIQEIKGISDAAIHGAKVIVYDAQDDNLTSLSAMLDQLVQSSDRKSVV